MEYKPSTTLQRELEADRIWSRGQRKNTRRQIRNMALLCFGAMGFMTGVAWLAQKLVSLRGIL